MSRGLIVPELLVAETMAQAWSIASRLDVSMYAPFRLIVMSKSEWIIASSNGCALVLTEPEPLQDAIVLSSSGLGDHLVEDIRRDLFQQLVTGAPDALVAQDRFHRHQWRDKPHLSVLMSRPDARTVSRTVIDMCSDTLRLTHHNLSDQLLAESRGVRLELTLRRVEVHA